MNKRLGCFSTTAIISAIITALIIVSVAFASGSSMFSPGNLNAIPGESLGGVISHAQIGKQCALCHTAIWENDFMADRCVACHTDVSKQFDNTAALHGFLRESNPSMDCLECHTEHHGAIAPLTAFITSFPHERLGYSLAAHPGTTCADCHNGNFKTFDPITCTTCHSERDSVFTTSHVLAYGTDCLGCHDGIESIGAHFDHAITKFPLTGLHLDLICTKCHLDARTLVGMQNTPNECINCHAKDETHQGRFGTACETCHSANGWKPAKFDHDLADFNLTGKHINVACEACHTDGIYRGTLSSCAACHQKDDAHQGNLGTDCGSCHTPAAWNPATFNHNLSAFKLTGAHIIVDCKQCHKNDVFKGTPSNCFACHASDDNHGGSFGTNCGSCHTTTAWRPATFDHNLSAFNLTGAHLNVNCSQCHKNGVFKGTPSNCFACHASDDNHGGSFGTNCGSCHSTSSWKSATFDHNLSAFKLTGAHLNVNCSQCHKNGVFKGTPSNCFACHADPAFHSGMFGTNCAQCHSTSNWKASYTGPHPNSRDNGGIGHEGASCRDCHTQNLSSASCLKCHDSNNPGDGGNRTATPQSSPTQGPSQTPRPTRTPTATSQAPTATSQAPTATSQALTATSQPPTATPQPSETPQPTPTPGG